MDDLLDALRLERRGDLLVGRVPGADTPVFGGVTLAMCVAAACANAPEPARLHSIHGHFLRPTRGGEPIEFAAQVVKAGRNFTLNSITASQRDRPVAVMSCSFTADLPAPTYDVSGLPTGVPLPDEVPEPAAGPDDGQEEEGPWEQRWLGPSELRSDGTRLATHRHWFRWPHPIGDDPTVHAALMGYATDWTGVGGRPLDLESDHLGMISLDHSAWFHRPARVDCWLLQDVEGLVNFGGRGTLRGIIRDTGGRIVASMAQEMVLQPPGTTEAS